jgi:4-hydroxy-3-methylbut-2-enyl diphosphate reductase
MEIVKVSSQGFCKGVIRAIAIINKALKNNNIRKPIYMLGGLVHNKHIIKAYENKGIIIVDNIDDVYDGTVIITAHGVSEGIIDLIKSRNLDILNTTCFDVIKTHNLIKEKIDEGYDVVFYGKKTHPETKGVLGISEDIHLIEKLVDINLLDITNPNLVFATQTTMSYLDVIDILKMLQMRYPHIETYEEVCTATKIRQTALIEEAKNADLCIVVGDPKSNNTNKLKEVCLKHTSTPCIMVENIKDLSSYDFKNIFRIVVTAGASTPPAIVDELINGIMNNDFNSYLQDDDYLKIR